MEPSKGHHSTLDVPDRDRDRGRAIASAPTSTSKTLLYTVLFVFLFLFMEYSLNISSAPSSFDSTINQSQQAFQSSLSPKPSLGYNPSSLSDTSYASLSASLIEKEKLLIEKEEKYLLVLQKLNQRDLKLNYVDEQLSKLQSLLNVYRTHTKVLHSKLLDLQSKLNQTETNRKSHSSERSNHAASDHVSDSDKAAKVRQSAISSLAKQMANSRDRDREKVQGYMAAYDVLFKQMEDEEIESLLNQTRKQIKAEKSDLSADGYVGIDVEKVIKIEERDKIIDKHEDEYVLASKKSSLNSNTQIVDFRLIWDLGVVLIAATFGGIMASLAHQPLIVGYLLGGSFVGPGGLKLIQQYVQVETLAHIGSIFLLFNVGMKFNADKIKPYLRHSVLSLVLSCIGLYIACYLWFAYMSDEADFDMVTVTIFAFAALNTSTTVVFKTMKDINNIDPNVSISDFRSGHMHEYDEESRQMIVSILLFQDLFFIFFMAVFSSVTQQRTNEHFIYKLLMVIIVVVIVFKALPALLNYLKRLISMDIYILFTISLCIIFTLITQNVFESSGLGAFTAGLLIAKSDENANDDNIKLLKTNWEPIRNMFGVLFFASIGMLINPVFLWINCWKIVSLVLFIAFFKFTLIFVSQCISLRHKNKRKNSNSKNVALNISTCLCLFGEFAFVLSAHARSDGLITMSQHTALLGATALSILITPFVIRHFASYFLHFFSCTNVKLKQFLLNSKLSRKSVRP